MKNNDIQNKINELHSKINNSKTVDEKILNYINLRDLLYYIDPIKSLKITEEALLYAKNNNATDSYYRLFYLKANNLVLNNNIEDAIPIYYECVNYFKSKENIEQLSLLYGNLSNLFYRLGVFNLAIQLFNYTIQNLISPYNKRKIAYYYTNLVNIYFYNLKILKFDIHFLLEIQSHFQEENDKNTPIYIYLRRNIARYYRLTNNLLESKEIYYELLIISNELNFYGIEHEIHFELGIINRLTGDYDKSINHFLNAEKIAIKFEIFDLLYEIYKEIYLYYKNEELFDKALEYFELSKKYEEKFFNDIENNKILLQKLELNYIFNDVNYLSKAGPLTFSQQRFVFEKNIKGDVIKINIDEIVYINKDVEILKICFIDSKIIHLKINFKDFVKKIKNLDDGNHMFFEANIRGFMINLYWLQKVDYNKKEVILKVLDKTYNIKISRRQILLLKKKIDLL